MELQTFIATHDVEKSVNLVSEDMLKMAEEKLAVDFGSELTEYLLEYGYLAFEYVEMYGMNSRQGLGSDMVKQTLYLHKYFPETVGYVALENQGDGDYFVVSSDDKVYEYDSNVKQLTATDLSMFSYIMKRFSEVAI